MSTDNRIRTRGLVVAALLSVASFSGAEKSSVSQTEPVVKSLNSATSAWQSDGDHQVKQAGRFGVPSRRRTSKSAKKETSDQDKENSLSDNGQDTWKRRGLRLSKGGSDHAFDGQVEDLVPLDESFCDLNEGLADSPKSIFSSHSPSKRKLKRQVSWGKNTIHLTHSGDDYDRTSYPDPYDSDDDGDTLMLEKEGESIMRPCGISILVLYLAMLIVTAVPSGIFDL